MQKKECRGGGFFSYVLGVEFFSFTFVGVATVFLCSQALGSKLRFEAPGDAPPWSSDIKCRLKVR